MIDKVAGTIRKYSMLNGGETVLVGLSGGHDSVCLLYALNQLINKLDLKLHAVYVNHNLRPDETPYEIEFCIKLCSDFNVNFLLKSIDVKSYTAGHAFNKQEAARELRYTAFDETAFDVKADRIALAHNADDQIETLFMRLIRGTGTKGLSCIPPKRRNIIRPLIETDRREIEDYIEKEKLGFVVDSSNLKTDYLRNRIRLSIIPELKKLNPNLINTILNTISIIQDEEDYFEIIVTKTLMKLISRKNEKRIELFLAPLEVMDTVLLRRVLRRVIDEMKSLRGIGFTHIEDIIRLIKQGKSGDRLYLPKGIRIIKEYAVVAMTCEAPLKISEYELQSPGEAVVKDAGLVIRASSAEDKMDFVNGKNSVLLDADKINFPLKIRPRKKGDFFYPLGFGKRKKLQDFFVDEKVPRDERDSIPIVVSGNDVVWIAGYRGDERFKPSGETRRFLRLECKRRLH